MTDVIEYSYDDANNTIDLLLKADGSAVNLGAVTRITLSDIKGSWTVDHGVPPGDTAFDWAPGTIGKIVISLGGQSIDAGVYRCRLKVYDPTNTDGIVWSNDDLVINHMDDI